MGRGAKRWLAIAVIGVAMLAGAYAGYWFLLSSQLQRATLDWIEVRRLEGTPVSHEGLSRRGFPLRVRVEIERPAFATQALGHDIALSSERAALSLSPFAPHDVTLSFAGTQTLDFGGSAPLARYTGAADTLEVEQRFGLAQTGGQAFARAGAATVRVRGLELRTGGTNDRLAIARLDGTADELSAGASGHRYELEVMDIELPRSLNLPFGNVLERAALTVEVQGRLGTAPLPDAIMAWRDAGGVIELRQIELASGRVRLAGEGTLALDRAGQPIGAMTLRLTGYEAVVDLLAGHGILNTKTAVQIKQLLALRASGSGTGGRSARISLTLQDRILSTGPLPLLQVPPIEWGPHRDGTSLWRANTIAPPG